MSLSGIRFGATMTGWRHQRADGVEDDLELCVVLLLQRIQFLYEFML
jgi:hypothetical protein